MQKNSSNGFYEVMGTENYMQRLVNFMAATDGKIYKNLYLRVTNRAIEYSGNINLLYTLMT